MRQPTENQKAVFSKVIEKVRKGTKVSVSKEMRESGLYSESMSKKPDKLTTSKGWQQLLKDHLSDESLSEVHEGLLKSTRMDHMIFPLGPAGEDDPNVSGAQPDESSDDEDEEREEVAERTTLTDKEIIVMLAEVNCTVRRIVHGESARHVYFWSPDNKARKEGLDMAYKLKGKYAPEKSLVGHFNAAPEQKQKSNEVIRRILARRSK